ncbi:uncharacterized protein METZ01_LOCUS109165 [marine metagenome]|uniref:Uncharacterized protein n=1 Tax=marine metagenome TaxID=408172 RepID=A0A381WVL3_9ZZZZ
MGSIKTKDESNRQWSYSTNKSLALSSTYNLLQLTSKVYRLFYSTLPSRTI